MNLYPYQVEGAQWLSKMPHALLADEMGLGKSAQAITACDHIDARNIVVVCPASVRVNWDREFTRFSKIQRPSKVLFTGDDRPTVPGINVISYDLLASNEKLRAAMKAVQWDVLILDEAHYLKERTAKRTKAIYGHRQYAGLMQSSKRCWRLTGTPMPNNPSELYAHLKSMGVENRSYWDFVFDFCDGFNGDYGYKITGVKNAPRLKALLSQIMLRRKKEEVMPQLPDITFSEVTVERSKVELDPYFYENWRPIGIPAFLAQLETQDKTLKASMEAIRSGHHHTTVDTMELLKAYTKSTSTLRRYIGMAKLPAILEILKEELRTKQVEKIVLFAVHKDVIDTAREQLREFHPVTLYGNTPYQSRQRRIDAFQADRHTRVFIGQIVAAGTGINLTRSNEVAFLESDWVPANNAQAVMRCHRIGQTRHVRVRMFTCAGSVDEDVMRVLVHKTREIAKVFD